MDESICIKFPQSDNKTENPLALLFISFPKSKRSFLHSMTSFVKNYFPFYDMKIIHEKIKFPVENVQSLTYVDNQR